MGNHIKVIGVSNLNEQFSTKLFKFPIQKLGWVLKDKTQRLFSVTAIWQSCRMGEAGAHPSINK